MYEHNDTIKIQRSFHFVTYLFPHSNIASDFGEIINVGKQHVSCQHELHCSIKRIKYNIKYRSQ